MTFIEETPVSKQALSKAGTGLNPEFVRKFADGIVEIQAIVSCWRTIPCAQRTVEPPVRNHCPTPGVCSPGPFPCNKSPRNKRFPIAKNLSCPKLTAVVEKWICMPEMRLPSRILFVQLELPVCQMSTSDLGDGGNGTAQDPYAADTFS